MLCLTWNVGNAKPEATELSDWLPTDGGGFDLIVVGTQENAFSEKKGAVKKEVAVTVNDEDGGGDEAAAGGREEGKKGKERTAWEVMVETQLGQGYSVVEHIVLWEMRLTVYAKSSHLGIKGAITNVQSAKSATGIGGVLGNKVWNYTIR